MSRFTSSDRLPLPRNKRKVDELKRFFDTHNNCIKCYVNGTFSEAKVKRRLSTELNELKLNMIDGDANLTDSIAAAKYFVYETEQYQAFLKRFRENLAKQLGNIFSCAAAIIHSNYDCFGINEEHLIFDTIDDALQNCEVINEDICFCSVDSTYYIEKNECDFLFHILQIILLLCKRAKEKINNGVVVVCESLMLSPGIYLLSSIIHDSLPPQNLYSFIPLCVEQMPPFPSEGSISLIFHSSDLDTAAMNCLTSLVAYGGRSKWRSSIIFVEESVEERFIEKLRKATRSKNEKHNCFVPKYMRKALEAHLKDCESIIKQGGIPLDSDGRYLSPYFIHKIPESALNFKVGTLPGPVGYIVPFRTTKEVISLVKHFVNQRYFVPDILVQKFFSPIPVNIWLDSASLTFQLLLALTDIGISKIFVNSSFKQMFMKMYEGLRFLPLCGYVQGRVGITSDQSVELKILHQMTLASVAQKAWSKLGTKKIFETICKLNSNDLHESFDINSKLKVFCEKFCHLLDLDQQLGIRFTDKCDKNLVLAHQFLIPRGPIIVLLPEKALNSTQMLPALKVLFFILCSGNSILALQTNNLKNHAEDSNAMYRALKYMQSCFNVPNVFSLLKFDSTDKDQLLGCLSNVCHPGIVIDMESIDFTNEHALANPHHFLMPTHLYWSVGDDLFAN